MQGDNAAWNKISKEYISVQVFLIVNCKFIISDSKLQIPNSLVDE